MTEYLLTCLSGKRFQIVKIGVGLPAAIVLGQILAGLLLPWTTVVLLRLLDTISYGAFIMVLTVRHLTDSSCARPSKSASERVMSATSPTRPIRHREGQRNL